MKLFISSLVVTVLLFATTALVYFNAPGVYEGAYGPSVMRDGNGTQDLAYKGDIQVGSDLTVFYILASTTLILLLTTIVLGLRHNKNRHRTGSASSDT